MGSGYAERTLSIAGRYGITVIGNLPFVGVRTCFLGGGSFCLLRRQASGRLMRLQGNLFELDISLREFSNDRDSVHKQAAPPRKTADA